MVEAPTEGRRRHQSPRLSPGCRSHTFRTLLSCSDDDDDDDGFYYIGERLMLEGETERWAFVRSSGKA